MHRKRQRRLSIGQGDDGVRAARAACMLRMLLLRELQSHAHVHAGTCTYGACMHEASWQVAADDDDNDDDGEVDAGEQA